MQRGENVGREEQAEDKAQPRASHDASNGYGCVAETTADALNRAKIVADDRDRGWRKLFGNQVFDKRNGSLVVGEGRDDFAGRWRRNVESQWVAHQPILAR